jgi:cytochrome c oxidase assembly protein Cox11
MQYIKKSQQGLTVTSWIVLLAILIFFILLGVKMVPTYMEFHSMSQVLESIKQDTKLKKVTPKQLRVAFIRRIDINGIYDFDQKENLKISKAKGKTSMTLDYEVRKPVAGNVQVVMIFHKEVSWK